MLCGPMPVVPPHPHQAGAWVTTIVPANPPDPCPQNPLVEGTEPQQVTAACPQQDDTPSPAAALQETILATGMGALRRQWGFANAFPFSRTGTGRG